MRLSRWSIRGPEGLEEGVYVHHPEHVVAREDMILFHDDLRSVAVWLDDDGWDALGRIADHRAYDRLAPS